MAERPAALTELLLQVRTEHTGLDPGQPGLLVDLQYLVQATEVERHHLARLVGRRLQAAGDVAATTERNQYGVRRHHRVQYGDDLLLVGRVHHHVGDPAQITRADPE